MNAESTATSTNDAQTSSGQIALAEMEFGDAKIDELDDVEGVLAFSQRDSHLTARNSHLRNLLDVHYFKAEVAMQNPMWVPQAEMQPFP